MKRVEQIRVQQEEIKLKSSGVRSIMLIWAQVNNNNDNNNNNNNGLY